MYRVIHLFHDLTDFTETKAGRAYHQYNVGDPYPRKGTDPPSEERINELETGDNTLGIPLIERVSAPKKRTKKG